MKTKTLLLFAFPLLLTACGWGSGNDEYSFESVSLDESDSISASYSGGKQTLHAMFHVDLDTAEGQAYKKRIDAFNQVYASTGLRVVPEFINRNAGGTDYETVLITKQMDGSLPDLITIDSPNCGRYADAELIVDVSDAFSESEVGDFLTLNTYQNRIYAVPVQESSAGFFYNKNIFRAANIDVSAYTVENPWTFEQFKEVCAKLKAYGTMPVDMRLDATGDETATYLLYSFIHAAGGKFLSDDGLTATGYFNSVSSKRGFQFIKDLIDAEYTSYRIQPQDFFTGKAGMYLSAGWTIPELDSKFPQQFPNRGSWGLLPYPKDVIRASATGSWSYAVTNNGVENKAGAIELLKWMSSTNSCNTVAKATGMVPVRKSCETPQGEPEQMLFKQLEQTGIERPVTIGYPEFTLAFSNMIYKLRNNTVDAIIDSVTSSLQQGLDLLK